MSSAVLATVASYAARHAGGNAPDSTEQARALTVLEEESAEFRAATLRQFHATAETWYPQWWGTPGARCAITGVDESARLNTGELVSITSLAVDLDGDGTFETALVENTDYRVHVSREPDEHREWIWLDPNGTQLASWPVEPRRIRITGVRGWSYEVEDTGQTVQNATQISAGGTALTVTSNAGISIGETLKIESEQVYVSAKDSTTGLTIERAVNGTTAAAHANGVAIYRRRYPRMVEAAVRDRAGMRDGRLDPDEERTAFARYMRTVAAFRKGVV